MYKKGSSYLLSKMAGGGDNAVVISRCFAMESGELVGLRTITLDGRFENASIMPVAVIHACVPSHYSSGSICTIPPVSVMNNTVPSDFGHMFACLATHTRRTACFFFEVITSCALSFLSLCFSGRSLTASICIVWNYR